MLKTSKNDLAKKVVGTAEKGKSVHKDKVDSAVKKAVVKHAVNKK